jgi:signal transduction histidine kinase
VTGEPGADCTETPPGRELLRRAPLFAGLPEEDLDRLCRTARVVNVAAGQRVIEEGSAGDALYVILEGELEVTKRAGDRDVVLAVRRVGEFVGERSLLEQVPRSASVTAIQQSRLLEITRLELEALLANSPAARLAMLQTMTSRLQSTEQMLMQHHKMAALGTLAAGLAHELNNPAAAIRRSAEHLREVLERWERLAGELATLGLDHRQVAKLTSSQAAARRAEPDAGVAHAQEEAVEAWLEAHAVGEAWILAPELASAGWEPARLQRLAEQLSPPQLAVLVQWLGFGILARKLVAELRTSAEAISAIVQAVKVHTHLGQAPIQEVDVRESLENTLVILRHKLKRGIRVVRDYAADLPRIEAYASELNQVWTNIVDNAIDAMQGRGELRIRVAPIGAEQVLVEITDNGPGIPPELQPKIFEPFLTTKPPGKGTGLGLHLAYNIVVDRHRGEIQVQSRPGETRFQVSLPVRLARDTAESPPTEQGAEAD